MSEIAAPVAPSPEAPVSDSPELAEAIPEKKPWDGRTKAKVNGVDEDLDLNDPDTLQRVISSYQIDSAAKQRLRNASIATKKIEKFANLAKENPIEALKEIGVSEEDAAKFFEKYYTDRMNYEQLPEEQKQLKKLYEENAFLRQKHEELNKQKEMETYNQEVSRQRVVLDEVVGEAMQEAGIDVADDSARFEIISELLHAVETGYTQVTPREAVVRYKHANETKTRSKLQKAGVEELIGLLGEEKLKAIREHSIKQAKANPVSIQKDQNPTVNESRQNKKPSIYMSETDAIEEARRRFGS